ncbi:MAG: D-alanyl-D-alanine carboxypeptidase [Rhodocyclaceae bacterium]|nr:D-alanyl-D-alanine carboxypeptidase [Rhodocyclaceae bacterium]MBX3666817.1 D-alanyl-D-alanine carboxypeptidase [Rhodocyclaceae bacterium]
MFSKRRLAAGLLAAVLSFSAAAQVAPQAPGVAAKSWLLLDPGSGQLLTSGNPDERVEPASLTKLMTAYLVFSAIKGKQLSLDQTVPVSTQAWKTGGSRMFIEPDRPVTVQELIRGMIIQSGNDACVALAEAVAGSEENFAQMMNREAARLGLKSTHFMNATGLTDPQHYSTARDLAVLARAVIRDFPDFLPIYSTKDYTYNKIKQANRNRLLWVDPTVDGLKTGHTEAAGWCLIATAKRGERRLISVILGAASDGVRAQEAHKLLNYGFQFFDTVKVYDGGQVVKELPVYKGMAEVVKAGFTDSLVLSLPKGDAEKLKVDLVSMQPLLAPIAAGQQVATLKLSVDGKALAEYPVTALEAVPVAGFFGRLWDSVRLWLKKA